MISKSKVTTPKASVRARIKIQYANCGYNPLLCVFLYGTNTLCAFLVHLIRVIPSMGTNDGTKTDDGAASSSKTFPIPAAQRVKRSGMDFYKNTLGAPKYVVSAKILTKFNGFFFVSFVIFPKSETATFRDLFFTCF